MPHKSNLSYSCYISFCIHLSVQSHISHKISLLKPGSVRKLSPLNNYFTTFSILKRWSSTILDVFNTHNG